MSVADKAIQAVTVIKQLDLTSVIAVSTDNHGPARIHVSDLSDLKAMGLDFDVQVDSEGCRHISTVVDNVMIFGVELSEQYLAGAPF